MTQETEALIASDVAAEIHGRGHARLREDQPHLLR